MNEVYTTFKEVGRGKHGRGVVNALVWHFHLPLLKMQKEKSFRVKFNEMRLYWALNQEHWLTQNESAESWYSYYLKKIRLGKEREGDLQNNQLGKGTHLILGKGTPLGLVKIGS